MAHPVRSRLQVECLEAREVPDGSPTETFDALTPPSLPSGWNRWSNDATPVFTTASAVGVDGSNALVSSAGSRTAGLTWNGTQVDGDSGVAISLKADTLVPAFVFVRGSNLDTNAPSYLAAVVTRGLRVELREVQNGVATVLGSVTSPGSSVSLRPMGAGFTGPDGELRGRRGRTRGYRPVPECERDLAGDGDGRHHRHNGPLGHEWLRRRGPAGPVCRRGGPRQLHGPEPRSDRPHAIVRYHGNWSNTEWMADVARRCARHPRGDQ